jgi:hypothetical protein
MRSSIDHSLKEQQLENFVLLFFRFIGGLFLNVFGMGELA